MRERRLAWAISAACCIVIVLALAWPSLFASKTSEMPEQAPSPPTVYHLPEKAKPLVQPDRAAITPAKPAAKKPAPQPSTKPAEKAQPAADTSPVRPGYYVQVGAFREKPRADKMATRLKQQHWPVALVPKRQMLAVWVGPYHLRNEALKAGSQLEKEQHLKGFVVRAGP